MLLRKTAEQKIMPELLGQVWHYSNLGMGLLHCAALVIGTIYCLIQAIRKPSNPNEWHRAAWKDGGEKARAFAE